MQPLLSYDSEVDDFVPVAINNLGQIVGNAKDDKIVLLTPITN